MKLSVLALAALTTAGSGAAVFDKRIVGGSSASASSFPFAANVITAGSKGPNVCTAAFVSPTVLLTSAACVADSVSNKALAANKIVVGQGSPSDALDKAGKGSGADISKLIGDYAYPKTVTVHPGYNSIAGSDNIAILILAQPLGNSTSDSFGAKIIDKPETKADTLYTAIGYGSTSASSSSAYPSELQQVSLKVGEKSACGKVWASYGNLTNSVCLSPVKSSANVCNGDGLLVKADSKNNVGLVGLLNIVANKDDFTNTKCTATGVYDYFTTLGNYIGWLTQAAPLKESDFISTASFSYDTASDSSSTASASASASGSASHDGASASESNQKSQAQSSKPNSASTAKLASAVPLVLAAAAASAFF
ncbi:hypothetical protein GGI12_001955 [Dipsacomyces acuminosporus]|nr:hypothetical protein GGI12_001955 [Dipsacomyces acuminosporus]